MAIGLAPYDYLESWINSLTQHNITTTGIVLRKERTNSKKEWFIYDQDGNREDLIFITFDELNNAGIEFPKKWMHKFKLDEKSFEKLIVELHKNKNRPNTQWEEICLKTRIKQYLHNLTRLDGLHIAPNLFDFQLEITTILLNKTKVISLDPGHYGNQINLNDLEHLLKQTTIFIPSIREVKEILGSVNEKDAAQLFAEIGAKIVVIKMGEKGCLVYNSFDKQLFTVPIFKTKVIDPTGCGDAFCGGFLAGFLETEDCYLAAIYGSIAASFAIEDFGSHHLLNFNRSDAKYRETIYRERIGSY